MSINPYRFGLDNQEKCLQLQRVIEKYNIHYCLLSSCDRKWDTINTKLLKARYRIIHNNIIVTAGDSG